MVARGDPVPNPTINVLVRTADKADSTNPSGQLGLMYEYARIMDNTAFVSKSSVAPMATARFSALVRKITAWSDLSQIKSMSASGGSQNFADITSIADTVQRQIPTTRSAISMTIDAYDDPKLAWYADVTAADNARSPYALKMSFPNGSKLCANAYWSLMRVPTMATNEALMTQITLSYASEPVRYSTE